MTCWVSGLGAHAARCGTARQTLAVFTFGTQICGRLDSGAAREWLVPDGLGGYAMGTVSGLRTRRYHGLLVVSGDIPARRMMALAALDPVLTTARWRAGPAGHP